MNVFGVAAIVALAAFIAWLIRPVREFLIVWVPVGTDDWFRRRLHWVFLASAVLLGVLARSTIIHKESGQVTVPTNLPSNHGGYRATDTNQRAGEPPPGVRPRALYRLRGTAIWRPTGDKVEPIAEARIRLDEADERTDTKGHFEFTLDHAPNLDSLLRISHDSYLTRFMRLDDPSLVAQRPVELQRKMRIVVIESDIDPDLQDYDRKSIRTSLEAQLQGNDIEILSDSTLRDKIVNELHRYQEERALYDPKTIQQVGEFYGATHALFWSVHSEGAVRVAVARLASLKTAKILTTRSLRVQASVRTEALAVALGDYTLADLTEVKILYPKTADSVGLTTGVKGYAYYLPKTWTLWLTILPQGQSVHFPQTRLTVETDGGWTSSDVHIGTERLGRGETFVIYAVLVDEAYSQIIEGYLHAFRSDGLPINGWPNMGAKLLDHIAVLRSSS